MKDPKYEELRKKLFDLRLNQSMQRPDDKEAEYLKTATEIKAVRKEMADLIKESIENESKVGGRKK
ncbi:MAG: hypothetical protein PHI05_02470 [Bacilli bacterium]|nr:hypothetical protein [Bacilli bacterium]